MGIDLGLTTHQTGTYSTRQQLHSIHLTMHVTHFEEGLNGHQKNFYQIRLFCTVLYVVFYDLFINYFYHTFSHKSLFHTKTADVISVLGYDSTVTHSFINHRTYYSISHSSQCSTTGVTKAVVGAILSVG